MDGAGASLFGRDHERAEFGAALAEAEAGHGSTWLVTGTAGIGKSALAYAVDADARARGFRTYWGRCWAGSEAPAFWPWVQVLRGFLAPSSSREAIDESNAAGLLPALRANAADLGPFDPDASGARLYAFDAVTHFLRSAAETQPLLVVLDDLHSADDASLRLFQFMARDVVDARILLLGTSRDLAGADDDARAAALDEMARSGRRLPLAGLDRAGVGALMEHALGSSPADPLVTATFHATQGNPFFVDEVARLLRAEQRTSEPLADIALPDGVRVAVRRRLASLPRRCCEMLTHASVIGEDFGVQLLERVLPLARNELLGHLADARVAGMVVPRVDVLGGYRFTHAIIRDTLYDDLAEPERIAKHRRVADALEALAAGDPDAHLDALAHHFFEAALGGSERQAAVYARRAGARAAEGLGYEHAVRHYERALQVMAFESDTDDPAPRAEVLLALGAVAARAGETKRAREVFVELSEMARRQGDGRMLAEAALGYGGPWVEVGNVDQTLVALLEGALALLDDGDEVLRVRVLARLARELYWSSDPSRGVIVGDRALALARRSGDRAALAAALGARVYAFWGPDALDERLAIEREIVSLAAALGDREMELRGRLWCLADLLERGEFLEADREIDAYDRLACESRQPTYIWYALRNRAMRALVTGRFDEAERLTNEAFAMGRRVHERLAAQGLGVFSVVLGWERGAMPDLASVLERFGAQYPGVGAWRAGLAFLYVEEGRVADARREFESLADELPTQATRDGVWLASTALLALVCASLGDEERAGVLYDALDPYAERMVFAGRALVCLGSVAYHLGALAATMGHRDEAAAHFERAIAMHARFGHGPWLARARVGYARMLLESEGAADRQRGRTLLAEAVAVAETLGMQGLVRDIRALETRAWRGRTLDAPAAGSPLPVGAKIFRREGEYWTIAFDDRVFRLRDTKGLHYIARLLAQPFRELHVSELVAAAPAPASRSPEDDLSVRGSLGDAGEMLDAQARAELRGRVEDLRLEIEEAERFHDLGRLAALRDELEFLMRELARAVGISGRSRRAVSLDERARVNVTKVIKTALRRIAEQSPALGRHLEQALHTGTACSYSPDREAQVMWKL